MCPFSSCPRDCALSVPVHVICHVICLVRRAEDGHGGGASAGERVWARAGALGTSELHEPQANYFLYVKQGVGLVPWRRPVQAVSIHPPYTSNNVWDWFPGSGPFELELSTVLDVKQRVEMVPSRRPIQIGSIYRPARQATCGTGSLAPARPSCELTRVCTLQTKNEWEGPGKHSFKWYGLPATPSVMSCRRPLQVTIPATRTPSDATS